MGRHRSDDSDGDRKSRKKKKRKARSRSRSHSEASDSSRYSSAKVKKSKKKSKRSSRSPDRRRGEGRSRRSRSRSGDRYAPSRGRSHSRSPDYRSRRRSRSRSRSHERRSSPPSYSRSRRSRSRGRSYSRERRSRSRDRRSRSRDKRSRDKRSRSRDRRSRSRSTGRTSSRRLSPETESNTTSDRKLKSEDIEERLRLALKAAALADEQLRQVESAESGSTDIKPSLGVLDRSDFADSVAAIESDSFSTSTFSSSRANKVKEESEHRSTHDDAIFGSLSVTGLTLKPDPDMRPIDLDADSIMHPSLYCDPDEKMDRWIQRLAQLRKRKLEGDAM